MHTVDRKKILRAFMLLHPGQTTVSEFLSAEICSPEETWSTVQDSLDSGLLERSKSQEGVFTVAKENDGNKQLSRLGKEEWQILFEKTAVHESILNRNEYSPEMKYVTDAYINHIISEDLAHRIPAEKWPSALVLTLIHNPEMWNIPVTVTDLAIAISINSGDLRAQAVLYSLKGLQERAHKNIEKALTYFEKAKETCEALGDPAITAHVSQDIVFHLINMGFLSEAVSYYDHSREIISRLTEEMDEPAVHEQVRQVVKTNEGENGLLALACHICGNHHRAMAILESIRQSAQKRDATYLLQTANLFAAMIYAEQGSLRKAESCFTGVYDYWRETNYHGGFAWAASIVSASIAMQKNNREDVAKILSEGHRIRKKHGYFHHFGHILMDVLKYCDRTDIDLPDGITLTDEISRMKNSDDIHMKGVALRYEAEKLFLTDNNNYDTAVTLLKQSGSLLQKAGADNEIALSKQYLRHIVGKKEKKPQPSDTHISRSPNIRTTQQTHPLNKTSISRFCRKISRLSHFADKPGSPFYELLHELSSLIPGEKSILLLPDSQQSLVSASCFGDKTWKQTILADTVLYVSDSPTTCSPADSAGKKTIQRVIIPFPLKNSTAGCFIADIHYSVGTIPPDSEHFLHTVSACLSTAVENILLLRHERKQREKLEDETRYYRHNAQHRTTATSGRITGSSQETERLYNLITRVAGTSSTVLITGETGTGKELVAREIHDRCTCSGPFVAAHIASLPESLVSDTLFGHEKGAFSGADRQQRGLFETADNGTLFLDEIGELSLDNQVRLLRVLQEGTFQRLGSNRMIRSNFRLLVATNRNLKKAVEKKYFREDLFFRLNVFPITVPPLRKRSEDIPELALSFLNEFSVSAGRKFHGIPRTDMKKLQSYSWPGNVRELMHVIERAVILSDEPVLNIPELNRHPDNGAYRKATPDNSLDAVMKTHIFSVLQQTGGKIYGETGAATILGIKPPTLYLRIEKLGLKNALSKIRLDNRQKK